MNHLPTYLWVITYGEITSIAAATAYLLYRGARAAGLGHRVSTTMDLGAALLNADLPLAIIPTVGVPLLLAMHLTSLRLLLQGRAADRVSDD